ncbi:hypothetical protein IJ182_09270 [bacterium]|nr:hypothetical protein [bacterium]
MKKLLFILNVTTIVVLAINMQMAIADNGFIESSFSFGVGNDVQYIHDRQDNSYIIPPNNPTLPPPPQENDDKLPLPPKGDNNHPFPPPPDDDDDDYPPPPPRI